MAQFIARFFKSVVEDVVVEKLSNNKAFQRVAVRAVEAGEGVQQAMQDGLKDPGRSVESAAATASSFFSHLKAEIARDMAALTEEPKAVGKGGDSATTGGSSGGPKMR